MHFPLPGKFLHKFFFFTPGMHFLFQQHLLICLNQICKLLIFTLQLLVSIQSMSSLFIKYFPVFFCSLPVSLPTRLLSFHFDNQFELVKRFPLVLNGVKTCHHANGRPMLWKNRHFIRLFFQLFNNTSKITFKWWFSQSSRTDRFLIVGWMSTVINLLNDNWQCRLNLLKFSCLSRFLNPLRINLRVLLTFTFTCFSLPVL